MTNFYCKHCGTRFSSVTALTSSGCHRHPSGPNKGKHVLYEGSEKAQYTCKYCGTKQTTLAGLTATSCIRHPNGVNKGKHEPVI